MFCSEALSGCDLFNLLPVTHHRRLIFQMVTVACLLQFSHRHLTAAKTNSALGSWVDLNILYILG